MTQAMNDGHDKSSTVDQMTRARELCGRSVALHSKLDAFLRGRPTRDQMQEFLEYLSGPGQLEGIELDIRRICKAAGVDEPTGSDRLMAMQIGLLQEQNELLTTLAKRAGIQSHQKQPIFTPVVAGILLGTLLAKS